MKIIKLLKIYYKKIFIIIVFTLLVVVWSILLPGIIKNRKSLMLSMVEINDYQGEKLDSINDFRDNSIKGPQYVNKDDYRLTITGLVDKEKSYSYEEVLKLPSFQKVVKLNCVEGWSVDILWEGVLVKDLLKDFVINPKAKTIIFYAADDYSTSFPLDYVLNNNIIMAYKMNGVILPPERGFPFQLVAEQKWGYKWIKWVTKIELSDNTEYKGYWEERGASNDGDINGPKSE